MSRSTVSPQDRGELLFMSVVMVTTTQLVMLDTCSHAPSPVVRCHVLKELHSFSCTSLALSPTSWRRGEVCMVSGRRLAQHGSVVPEGMKTSLRSVRPA